MEPNVKEESSSEAESKDEAVRFSRVTAVAADWMLDFLFVSLCRQFKEGNQNEFNRTIAAFEAISKNKSLKETTHKEKVLICAFLSRVINGKELDYKFEEDDSVMPLMSAANVWEDLKQTVDDKSFFKDITVLLLVQSAAVCLEKGHSSSASSALKWFKKHHDFPQKLGEKLSTIVTNMETYHSFFINFSFNRLMESTQSYLDAYLKKNPSDYLLKAATAAVQSSRDGESSEEVVSQDEAFSETSDESVQMKKKSKRKLLSTKTTDAWKPDTIKKAHVSVRRLSRQELSQMMSANPLESSTVKTTRRKPRKWTPQLDRYLKEGVKRHGEGKWSYILQDYDFEGRTGTMLKDRWRILLKSHEVG